MRSLARNKWDLAMQNLLPVIAGVVLASVAAAPASAQEWPAKQPIRVIVTLSAGSATDVLARIAFEQVGKQIGQSIVIDNRPGAGQRIGAQAVARAEPDGYTLLVNGELSKALETPVVRERFSSLGADPMPMRPSEFDEFIRKEVELNASIGKAAGITPQ
jgi:tripartite-type tricarboxylate transporter receptor subunit TctC